MLLCIKLMFLDARRTSRCFLNFFQLHNLKSVSIRSVCHRILTRDMKQINVKGASTEGLGEELVEESLSTSEDLSSLSVKVTPALEKKYVHHVYDAIAPHFSATRFAKWPKVATFINSLSSGSLVLDAGCGNGKYLGLNPDCFFIGCDISAPLIKICADRGHEVLVADAVNLPYRTGFGDAAISIAVLHHLSTDSRRRKAIEELVRVVKKGGLVLITVWAVEQEDKSLLNKWTPLTQKYVEEWIGPGSPRVRSPSSLTLESIPETEENGFSGLHRKFSENNMTQKIWESKHITSQGEDKSAVSIDEKTSTDQQEYFVPWHLPYHRAEVSGASACALASGLAKKDDKKGAVVYNRYYHVFSQGELERYMSCFFISVDCNLMIIDRLFYHFCCIAFCDE